MGAKKLLKCSKIPTEVGILRQMTSMWYDDYLKSTLPIYTVLILGLDLKKKLYDAAVLSINFAYIDIKVNLALLLV